MEIDTAVAFIEERENDRLSDMIDEAQEEKPPPETDDEGLPPESAAEESPPKTLQDKLMRVSDIAVSASVNGIFFCPLVLVYFLLCTVLYCTDFTYELPI